MKKPLPTHYGFIQESRSIQEWEWYSDIKTCHLYRHLNLNAAYVERIWQGVVIKRGQILTSLRNLSLQTCMSYQEIRTSIEKLKKSGVLTQTEHGKYSIYTITYYDTTEPFNTNNNTATHTDSNTPINTSNNTDNNTLNNTSSTQIISNTLIDQDVPAPNKDNKEKKERKKLSKELKKDNSLESQESENSLKELDFENENPAWFLLGKFERPDLTDEEIKFSREKFVGKKPLERNKVEWKKWIREERKSKITPAPSEKLKGIALEIARVGTANWKRRMKMSLDPREQRCLEKWEKEKGPVTWDSYVQWEEQNKNVIDITQFTAVK